MNIYIYIVTIVAFVQFCQCCTTLAIVKSETFLHESRCIPTYPKTCRRNTCDIIIMIMIITVYVFCYFCHWHVCIPVGGKTITPTHVPDVTGAVDKTRRLKPMTIVVNFYFFSHPRRLSVYHYCCVQWPTPVFVVVVAVSIIVTWRKPIWRMREHTTAETAGEICQKL